MSDYIASGFDDNLMRNGDLTGIPSTEFDPVNIGSLFGNGDIPIEAVGKLEGATDDNGNWIKDLITSSIDSQSKEILGEYIFSGSGALAIKTDANNGLWISPSGILGKKAGANTFTLDNSGNATFAGTLVATSGTLGTITAGNINGVTITGGTLQTAASGLRTILNSNNILFYNNAIQKGFIRPDSGQSIVIGSADDFYLTNLSGTPYFKFNSNGNFDLVGYGKKITFGSGRYIDDSPGDALYINGIVSSNSDNVDSLGKSTKRWSNVYGGNIRGDAFYAGGTRGKSGTSTYGFVTAVESSRAKWREFTVKEGIITSVSRESGWG